MQCNKTFGDLKESMIINELKSIDLNELTPIEALTELFNLRKMIDEKWEQLQKNYKLIYIKIIICNLRIKRVNLN